MIDTDRKISELAMTDGARGQALDQRIRARAHAIWEAEGKPEGRDGDHWLRAEREIAPERDGSPDYLESISGIPLADAPADGDALIAALPAEQPEPQAEPARGGEPAAPHSAPVR